MKNKYVFRLLAVILVIGAAWLISANFYQFMLIQGNSMQPSYRNMQLVILDKHSKDYDYGDVIAFHCEELEGVLVKRIVACPGDRVEIEDGTLYVNGEKSRVFPGEAVFGYSGLAEEEMKLTEGCYFVIGDNIPESKDSRYTEVGCVDRSDIIGEILK